MPRFRFTVRRMMVAVAVVALPFGWFAWMNKGACMTADIANRTASTLHDLRVVYDGGTLDLGDLPPGITRRMGRFHETWTDATISYADASGARSEWKGPIGIDLRRPISSTGDSGQAAVEIGPAGIFCERRYWVALWKQARYPWLPVAPDPPEPQ